jgi:hypothetical protein
MKDQYAAGFWFVCVTLVTVAFASPGWYAISGSFGGYMSLATLCIQDAYEPLKTGCWSIDLALVHIAESVDGTLKTSASSPLATAAVLMAMCIILSLFIFCVHLFRCVSKEPHQRVHSVCIGVAHTAAIVLSCVVLRLCNFKTFDIACSTDLCRAFVQNVFIDFSTCIYITYIYVIAMCVWLLLYVFLFAFHHAGRQTPTLGDVRMSNATDVRMSYLPLSSI